MEQTARTQRTGKKMVANPVTAQLTARNGASNNLFSLGGYSEQRRNAPVDLQLGESNTAQGGTLVVSMELF
jgi:hypothetical protein